MLKLNVALLMLNVPSTFNVPLFWLNCWLEPLVVRVLSVPPRYGFTENFPYLFHRFSSRK